MKMRHVFSRNLLVSVKRTRLEAEARRLNLNGAALDQELLLRGFNLQNLHASHDAHHRSLDAVLSALTNRGVKHTMRYAKDLHPEHLKDIDFVICLGGDGTLLETAQLVKTSSVPVLGVNSDPQNSTGKLCSIALRSGNDFKRYLNRIEQENFSWFFRSRIGIALIEKHGHRRVLDRSALNEILLAERDVCRATMHQTKIDDDHFSPVQRSCGVLVCTGSGSTAWMHSSSSIRQDDVELILDAAGVYDAKHMAPRIANVVNREFILPPTSSNVSFFIRELIPQPNLKELPRRRGFASSITVRSLGFDTYLFLDGIANVAIENGTTVVMQISPEKALRTFTF